MGRNKKYNGYKAFQYLERGFDYKDIPLCKEFERVPSYFVPLSKTEEERYEELIKNNILINLHTHPFLFPEDIDRVMELMNTGRGFTAYEALSRSGLDCVFDNVMDGISYITSYSGWKWTDVIHDIGIRLSDIHHQEMVIHCLRVKDIKDAFENGKVALVICLESATPIENELDRIDVLYGLGVRSMGICYSESNMLGGARDLDIGLTDFGYDAVKRMNKLGMLIDRGHANNRTVLETVEASDKPVYVSHSGPAALTSLKRVEQPVSQEEMMNALSEKEGLFAVGSAGWGARTEKNPVGNIEGFMECVEYCIEVMGIDHVGCGPDTTYGDHQGMYRHWFGHERTFGHHERPGKERRERRQIPEGMKDPGYVVGLENPNEFVNIVRWMILHGYSDEEISKIVGSNAVRLLEKVWV
jgi:membrane dipeptidase